MADKNTDRPSLDTSDYQNTLEGESPGNTAAEDSSVLGQPEGDTFNESILYQPSAVDAHEEIAELEAQRRQADLEWQSEQRERDIPDD